MDAGANQLVQNKRRETKTKKVRLLLLLSKDTYTLNYVTTSFIHIDSFAIISMYMYPSWMHLVQQVSAYFHTRNRDLTQFLKKSRYQTRVVTFINSLIIWVVTVHFDFLGLFWVNFLEVKIVHFLLLACASISIS